MPSDTVKKYLGIYTKLKEYLKNKKDLNPTITELSTVLSVRPSTIRKAINFAKALEIAKEEYPLVYQKILSEKIKGGVSRLAENDDPDKIRELLKEIASQIPEPAPQNSNPSSNPDPPQKPKSKLEMILEKPKIITMGIPSAEEIVKECTKKEERRGERWVLDYGRLYPLLEV